MPSPEIALPTVTVVTPSYNQARFLNSTILSALNQREDIHEFFVFDGGSTDGSQEIIKRHAGQIDYWQSRKDGGQGDAIHQGLSRATGDILFWINSDDVIAPGAIRRVREAFARNLDWDVLTGYSVFLDESDLITQVNLIDGESQFWLGLGILHVCQQTCYFRRKLYERVGGIDTSLHCMLDTELWLRFFRANASWGHLPAILGGFRMHELMKGRTWTDKYTAEKRIVASRFPQYRPKPPSFSLGRLLYGMSKLAGKVARPERWSIGLKRQNLLAVPAVSLSGR